MQSIHAISEKILELPRPFKRAIAVAADILLCLLTVALAYRLRLDAWILPIGNQWLSYAAAPLLAIPIFIRFGLYRAIFRYVGWHALNSVTWACALYGALYAGIFTFIGIPVIPRSTGILQPILLFLAVGASRAVARYWLSGGYAAILGKSQRRRVLIYGAGSAGRQLAAGLANSQEMLVVGFVDDDPVLHGSFLNGKKIYAPDAMIGLIDNLGVADILLAIPSASRKRRNEIIDGLRGQKVSVRTLPGIFDLADGKVTVSDLRPLEIGDLLGRDRVPPDVSLLGKCITGKTVLVSGAGGSIGSELCRQIVDLHPAKLILVDHGEYNLYSIEHELRQQSSAQDAPPVLEAMLVSVQDEKGMDDVIGRHRPETIYHAAAYKHVPMVEANAAEGIRNNVFGTKIVAGLAEKHGVCDFVLISTDKAVRPPNIMGASKRIAEMLLQAKAAAGSPTRFTIVRFGNVLGSSGSVVPLFRKQIAAGGPVTVTHPEVTRYFMTIPEAAQLVIQAAAMADGGDVFVLDMGEPVKIIDLAQRMIELSGLRVRWHDVPDGDIEIRVIGLRPAEKLYEELLIGESPEPTRHPRIMKAHEAFPQPEVLEAGLSELNSAAYARDDARLRAIVTRLVPTVTNGG